MKRNTLIFVIVLILAFLLIGELSTGYFREVLYSYPFVKCESLTENQIERIGKYPIIIASLKEKSSFFAEYELYVSPSAQKILLKDLNLFQGEYFSLFQESYKYEIKQLDEYKSSNCIVTILLEENDAKNVSSLLESEIQIASKTTTLQKVSFILFLTLIFYVAFSFYDAAVTKKEITIRSIYGESIIRTYFKKVFTNNIVIILAFAFCFFGYKEIYGHFIFVKQLCVWLLVILLLTDCSYLYYFIGDFKKNIYRSENRDLIFSVNYILKFFASIILVVFFTASLFVIPKVYGEYKQQKMFENLGNGVFIDCSYDIKESDDVFAVLQKRYEENLDIFCSNYDKLYPVLFTDFLTIGDSQVILVNSNAVEYLNRYISFEPKNMDIYIFQRQKNQEEINFIKSGLFLTDEKIEEVYYSKDLTIPVLKSEVGETAEYKNPIIVYCNFTGEQWREFFKSKDSLTFSAFPFKDVVYSKVPLLHKQESSHLIITNVNQYYRYQINSARAKVILSIFMLLVSALFFMSVSVIIHKLTYLYNGKELAIKHLSGQRIYSLLIRPWLYDNLAMLLAIIVVLFIGIKNEIPLLLMVLSSGLALLIGNFIFIISHRNFYRANLLKILKNGADI